MMRRWVFLAFLAGCSVPQGGLMVEPMMAPMVVPVADVGIVLEAARAPVGGPSMRPRARPDWIEHCRPGDDGIGGTGCPVD